MSQKVSTKVNENKFKALGLGLVLLIVPLIVFLKTVNLEGVSFEYWTGQKSYVDFFSYYKAMWLMILTGVSALLFFYSTYKKQIDCKAIISQRNYKVLFLLTPILIYFVFVFLSTSYSQYKQQALWGFTDRCEGFLVISCYIILCLFAIFTVDSKADLKLIFTLLLISASIISLLGVTQFFGFDFFQTMIGKNVILPSSAKGMADSLKFNFPKNYIYGTLYNPNYVGTYFSMLLPICLTFLIMSKSRITKVLTFILTILSFVSLVGSLSMTGYIGGGLAILILIVILRKNVIYSWKSLLLLFACCIPLVFIMNNISSGAVLGNGSSLSNLQKAPSPQTTTAAISTSNITDFNIEGDKFLLYVDGNALNVTFNESTNQCSFIDEASGSEISVHENESQKGKFAIKNDKFKDVSLGIDNNILSFEASNTTISVAILKGQGFKALNNTGKAVDLAKPQTYGFVGKETFASNRGYIWSRTLPLIKNTIFIGNGPDTYAFYFPQNELNAKLKYFNSPYIIVDKPHCFYLQLALNTGLLSLLAFLLFCCIYIISSLVLYFRVKALDEFYACGISCLVAVIGFLVASIANDSVVSVSPVFWILIGVGIACNRVNRKQLN